MLDLTHSIQELINNNKNSFHSFKLRPIINCLHVLWKKKEKEVKAYNDKIKKKSRIIFIQKNKNKQYNCTQKKVQISRCWRLSGVKANIDTSSNCIKLSV